MNESIEQRIRNELALVSKEVGINIDILYRDRVLRTYILGKVWEENGEFNVLQKFLTGNRYKEFLEKYPYIFDYEWEVIGGLNQFGQGDLILTDGKERYLIVESKFLGFGRRDGKRRKRRQLEEQVPRYIFCFQHNHPEAIEIEGIGITEDGILLKRNYEEIKDDYRIT